MFRLLFHRQPNKFLRKKLYFFRGKFIFLFCRSLLFYKMNNTFKMFYNDLAEKKWSAINDTLILYFEFRDFLSVTPSIELLVD